MLLLTRSQEENKILASKLKELGFDYLEFPSIAYTVPSDNYNNLDSWIKKNHTYDWAFFLSKKAAEVFFERLLAIGGNFFNISPRMKIACVGEATADFIRNEIGFPVNFVPSVFNSSAFIQEFLEKFHTEPAEIVLFRNEDVEDDFQERLEASGHIKLYISPAYKLAKPQYQQEDLAFLAKHDLEPIFLSSQTARNFYDLSQGAELKIKRIFSIGPKTSNTLNELYPGLELLESKEALIESVVESISNAYSQIQ